MNMRAERFLRDETGAETLEFALVFPVFALLVFGLIYGLLAVSAHVSLAHAASRGVRYASLAVDPVAGVYPSTSAVEGLIDDNTPFFTATDCETTVVGDAQENAPVTLDVSCDFPNPAGAVVSAIRGFLLDPDPADSDPGTLQISAHAEARRE